PRTRHALSQLPQPVEIVTEDRVLDPVQLKSGFLDQAEFDDRFLCAPRFIGIDHDFGTGAYRPRQQVEPVKIALEIGMADLDLEGVVAEGVRMSEERDKFCVAEVEIE